MGHLSQSLGARKKREREKTKKKLTPFTDPHGQNGPMTGRSVRLKRNPEGSCIVLKATNSRLTRCKRMKHDLASMRPKGQSRKHISFKSGEQRFYPSGVSPSTFLQVPTVCSTTQTTHVESPLRQRNLITHR